MNFIQQPEIGLDHCSNASVTHGLAQKLMFPVLTDEFGDKDNLTFLSPLNYFDFE